MSANAFAPQQNLTVMLGVTATSTSTPLQVKAAQAQGSMTQRLFYNAGPNTCFLVGAATAALAVAVAPTAGSPQLGVPIGAGAHMVLSFPPNTFFAAICAAAQTASLYITPGEGN